MGPLKLSEIDEDILRTLALKVRVLSIDQVARTWWPEVSNPQKRAAARMRELQQGGLIECFSMPARPVPDVSEPLAVWQPGLPTPDFKSVTHVARKRRDGESKSAALVAASDAGGRQFGGRGGRGLRVCEASHDLHVSEVFFEDFRRRTPARAASWVRDDLLLTQGHSISDKLPDALVTDGCSKTAIEICGDSYSDEDLQGKHDWCEKVRYGYELW